MGFRPGSLLRGVAGAALIAMFGTAAMAETLKIGLRSETPSIDPHFSYAVPSKVTATHMFDVLVERDKDLQLTPALATEWEKTGEREWLFKLRPGVKWHDGTPFTADDVVFTISRAGTVPNSPASFAQFLQQIEKAEAVDELTLKITTVNPSTQVLMDLSELLIVSRHAGEGAETADYNSGKATIGTGPYKFATWQPGSPLKLVRNDDYWRAAPEFDTVELIPIPNDAARVAALLAGGVDLIDAVPPNTYETLKANAAVDVVTAPDVFTAYLHMVTNTETLPGITAKDGSPIKNPLLDQRVRHALALSIDRQAIIDRVMYGLGQRASQLSGTTMLGYNPDIPQTPYDPAAAKALLAEAGYPDGFALLLAGPNDRYVADGEITQAIGQMFERIGIKTNVETSGWNVFTPKANAQELPVFFIAFGSAQGTTWSNLRAVIMTYDKEKGYGSSNRGRYSNAEVDRLSIEALGAGSVEEAARLSSEAAAIAYADYGIIPLHYQMNVWAVRKGLALEARQDSLTLAAGVSKAQ